MSYMTLLSSTGTQALMNFQANGESMYYLNSISTTNSATGKGTAFDNQSIFSNSSGISSDYSGTNYANSSYFSSIDYSPLSNGAFSGNDGLNRRGAISGFDTKRSAIPTSEKQYSQGLYGASLMGNFMTSIQNVALGQYAPTSVFEQRLNYHLDYEDQRKPGYSLGDTSNYFDIDSPISSQSISLDYGITPSLSSNNSSSAGSSSLSDISKVGTSNCVSEMMGIFGQVNVDITNNRSINTSSKNSKSSSGKKATSNHMSLMA